ncbi:hypothetical protein CCUG63695_02335 [Mycobacteroides franklinii]|uniref:Uncharacterized protein n=1 Tax=Mycobacteroides franklinii TaxID=948102 RepID=A0A4R8R8B4_9MYCO|nr:hypothetical protein CCUG64054_02408 [Mycobacteroides franklinii]TDZ52511.1 hypothetical protein CCUG63697_00993 [Mycobacteroides franklinii]TDZ55918.1 hypothetical protein CCUG63696_02410 [Mycobacteroides franklinii]TDZ62859.1 hypothetical protein CCUG63695_02335 [Mycobacteroides franklinii]TDZ69256.1 hypothetical protein CCUG64056_02408 [Mycobacteroides franklinii]
MALQSRDARRSDAASRVGRTVRRCESTRSTTRGPQFWPCGRYTARTRRADSSGRTREIRPAQPGLLLVHHGGSPCADALVLDAAPAAVSVQDLRGELSLSALTCDFTGGCAWPAPCLRVLRAATGEADQIGTSGHWARTRSPRHADHLVDYALSRVDTKRSIILGLSTLELLRLRSVPWPCSRSAGAAADGPVHVGGAAG